MSEREPSGGFAKEVRTTLLSALGILAVALLGIALLGRRG